MNIKWDAEKYTSDFAFVHQYGHHAAELIDAREGCTVLDLGCGNGALSKTLQEKGFLVTGIDASKELLHIAKTNYPEITFIQADAADFSLSHPVDVVFSNAVFHWIDKTRHPAMLQCVNRALKENGQFVFEFGGYGNNRMIHEALTEAFQQFHYQYQNPFYFPTMGEYSALLEQAGFQVRFAVLFDRMTELKGEHGLKEWIKMFIKSPFSVVKNKAEQEEIIETTVAKLQDSLYRDGKWYADYVRLQMKVIKNDR